MFKDHLLKRRLCTGVLFMVMSLNLYGQKKTIREFIDDTSTVERIVYKQVDDKQLFLFVKRPDKKAFKKKLPAMIWIHGGGWSGGNPEQFIPHMKYSAARGAVGLSIQYRLIEKAEGEIISSSSTLADAVQDCADAILYIREHAGELGIDPDKIIVIGDSAGGHLALCLGMLDLPKMSKANVVVNCNGITDLQNKKWLGNISKQNSFSIVMALSPIKHVDEDDAIVLNMNGDQDHVVEASETEKFHKTCLEAGVESEYIIWMGMKHAFIVTGYTATDEQITKAILALDMFLLERNYLEGNTSICY